LLIQKNTPLITTFFVLSELQIFREFLDSKSVFPFAQEISSYRISENPILVRLSSDINVLRSGNNNKAARITFLVIANNGDATAYEVVARSSSSDLTLGDISPHTAILVPTRYSTPSPSEDLHQPEYSTLSFEARVGNLTSPITRRIAPMANPTWAPVLGTLQGWARATPGSQSDYLIKVMLESIK
jgi:hypothetical protein